MGGVTSQLGIQGLCIPGTASVTQFTGDWERRWAPYDEPTYQAVLVSVRPDDVVLDIGAGDLRLAYRLAAKARQVVAIEINPVLVRAAVVHPLPDNLTVLCVDAYQYPLPEGVTLAILLMRHCRHFRQLADKLAAVGCQRLITNARWGMGVEIIDLLAPRLPYERLSMGWYACWCGATGFVPGPPEHLVPELEEFVYQVSGCPGCADRGEC